MLQPASLDALQTREPLRSSPQVAGFSGYFLCVWLKLTVGEEGGFNKMKKVWLGKSCWEKECWEK